MAIFLCQQGNYAALELARSGGAVKRQHVQPQARRLTGGWTGDRGGPQALAALCAWIEPEPGIEPGWEKRTN